MDTISVKLTINFKKKVVDGKEINDVSTENINEIRARINNIKSPVNGIDGSEYKYCDFLEMNKDNEVIVKISYPRFYFGNNGYLVRDSNSCLEVNRYFCNSLRYENFFYEVTKITLIRVDIPFTYMMRDQQCFWHYQNIYNIFDMVYRSKNNKANPKMISTIQDRQVETLNYASTAVVGNYNSKIMVYNQYKNLKEKLEDFQFNRTIDQFPDLSYRMRLEVSKRINRMSFTLDSFSKYDIYGEYYPKFKDYLLENLLDFNIIENFYNNHALQLAEALKQSRKYNNFNYEVFILNNLRNIFDYEIISRALCMATENIKTKEGAITLVKKILKGYQATNNIIVMDTYEYLRDIRNRIERNLC